MRKQGFFLPVIIVGLSIAFVAVSLLAVTSRGNPRWLRRKLRIGALLITLTGVGTGCSPPIQCYAPAEPPDENLLQLPPVDGENAFYLQERYPGAAIVVDFSQSKMIHGEIRHRSGGEFSFRLVDAVQQELQREDIIAADGTYDSSTEEFDITLRDDLQTGIYRLYLFATAEADQSDHGGKEFVLNVAND